MKQWLWQSAVVIAIVAAMLSGAWIVQRIVVGRAVRPLGRDGVVG